MMDISENISLPPGWDTKYDFRTGKRYFVNYFNMYTSSEDPRTRYKKFQIGEPLSIHTFSSSPARSSSPIPSYINQDFTYSSGRPSPLTGRSYSPLMGSGAIQYHAHKPHEYPMIETSVAKIKTLFPTVSDTHIKTLLHKYHYREALVVSALQVEKHPLTTPGPYSSPLAVAKHIATQLVPSAPVSPSKFFSSTLRSLSPKTPRSSPKMKLRYLKNVFPVVEETVLLDTLCSSENNVHKASETLQIMGFNKREMFSSRSLSRKSDTISTACTKKNLNDDLNTIFISLHDPEPINKSLGEKQKVKERLKNQFENINEDVITMALEAAEYNEERAEHFLSQCSKEDAEKCKERTNNIESVTSKNAIEDLVDRKTSDSTDDPSAPASDTHVSQDLIDGMKPECSELYQSVPASDGYGIVSQAEISQLHLNEISQISSPIESRENITQNKTGDSIPVYQPSGFIVTASRFINTFLKDGKMKSDDQSKHRVIPKGPDKSLIGQKIIPKGSNSEYRKGPNLENRKGPKGLSKGSIFSTFSKIRALSSQI